MKLKIKLNILLVNTSGKVRMSNFLAIIQNTKIELRGVDQEYSEKMNKAEGEKFQSLGMIETGKGDIAKLENQVASYTIRDGMYYILAPQNGQIINAKKAGIGELLKDGEELLTIVTKNTDYAVEMYVRPVDLPLVVPGQNVRFIFDGFPAIIFAGGWPDQSFGTFPGKIRAVENNIDDKGMFRVIVVEDPKDKKWPKQIKMGAGAQGITLLNDVPLWYELWRNINGFPADFYTVKKDEK